MTVDAVRPTRVLQADETAPEPLVPVQYMFDVVGTPGLEPPPGGDKDGVLVIDSGLDITHPDFAGRPGVLLENPQKVRPTRRRRVARHGRLLDHRGRPQQHRHGGPLPDGAARHVGRRRRRHPDVGDDQRPAPRRAAPLPRGQHVVRRRGLHAARAARASYRAFANGLLIVAAAGNENQQGNPDEYPALFPHVLTVAAVDDHSRHADFSNRKDANDVAAPGRQRRGGHAAGLQPVSQLAGLRRDRRSGAPSTARASRRPSPAPRRRGSGRRGPSSTSRRSSTSCASRRATSARRASTAAPASASSTSARAGPQGAARRPDGAERRHHPRRRPPDREGAAEAAAARRRAGRRASARGSTSPRTRSTSTAWRCARAIACARPCSPLDDDVDLVVWPPAARSVGPDRRHRPPADALGRSVRGGFKRDTVVLEAPRAGTYYVDVRGNGRYDLVLQRLPRMTPDAGLRARRFCPWCARRAAPAGGRAPGLHGLRRALLPQRQAVRGRAGAGRRGPRAAGAGAPSSRGAGAGTCPAASCDPDETPEDAVRRELREETGAEVEPLGVPRPRRRPLRRGRRPHAQLRSTSAASPRATPEPDDDVAELTWFAPDELPPPDEFAFANTVEALDPLARAR